MTIDLFQEINGDKLYNQLKLDSPVWHQIAREKLNNLYIASQKYLDHDFQDKFPKEFMSRLWELKLASYLSNLEVVTMLPKLKRNVACPDFPVMISNQKYFIEGVCADKGAPEKYPYLNTNLEEMPPVRDAVKGHREYRERITGALREKAICKYNPALCDPTICKHKKTGGYIQTLNGGGLIIAISTAKIDFYNQPLNWRFDLSCVFPFTPYMTINILPTSSIKDTHHQYSSSFDKTNDSETKINVDIFGNKNFSYISAIIISHSWEVLFPKINTNEQRLYFGSRDNDFMLIHNPHATVPLRHGILPVTREFIANIESDSCRIENIPYWG